jgi:murein DD-endopeptidase MepM/ murein hydrolase activator NlpD
VHHPVLSPRARSIACALVALAISVAAACAPAPAARAGAYPLVFPVKGGASYVDTFRAPRAGHSHQGQDLMAPKMRPVLAAMSGKVTWLRFDNGSTSGNLLTITAPDGWSTTYIHLNNDTPGTDNGHATRDQVFAPGITIGSTVTAGQFIAFVGDSGNAEGKSPHGERPGNDRPT